MLLCPPGAPATQELAGLLDAMTRLLLTQTQSIEVENCRPAHGLGLVRRRGAAQAAAIASRYTAPPSLHGGGLADVHVAPLDLVLHLLKGRHLLLGGHRHRAGVVVEPLGALVLQVGVGDPGGEQVEGSLGAHQG